MRTPFLQENYNLKPLIKWPGGKRRELEVIKRHLPTLTKDTRLIEPFVGGGAVFFDLEHVPATIADVHEDLINLYRIIGSGEGNKLYELMAQHDNTPETYYYIRNEFQPSNTLEKTFQFFFLRKTCYRGMMRFNRAGKFNIPFGSYKTYTFEELLAPEYAALLSQTEVLNASFEEVFVKYGQDEDAVFFLDPPYDSDFVNYGYCIFDRSYHQKLAQCFKEAKAKVLMVIGETPFIQSLYEGMIVERYHKSYAFKIRGGRVSDETYKDNHHLVITNYPTDA